MILGVYVEGLWCWFVKLLAIGHYIFNNEWTSSKMFKTLYRAGWELGIRYLIARLIPRHGRTSSWLVIGNLIYQIRNYRYIRISRQLGAGNSCNAAKKLRWNTQLAGNSIYESRIHITTLQPARCWTYDSMSPGHTHPALRSIAYVST